MYRTDIHLSAATYKTLFASSSGRLYVPVKPSVTVYTQFDHVRGTPAANGQKGVPVDRIRILNTLIDQLVSMKKSTVSKNDVVGLSDAQKDALIETYQKQIKTAVATSTGPGTYGLAGLMPEPGALFNITA